MALIREINTNENTINYISTIALFCAISCSIIMLRFRGFKATINLLSGKNNNSDSYDKTRGEPVCGAYRISRDEFFYDRGLPDPPKKIAPSPSMVHLPNIQKDVKPFKSTSDLTSASTTTTHTHTTPRATSTPIVTRNSKRIEVDKTQIKAQKKLEKQQQEEQKKLDKLAAQQKKKQDKLKKDRDKQRDVQTQKSDNSITKRSAPQLQQVKAPISSQPPVQYSTNTLESSISRSSGPPPYSPPVEVIPNTADNTGNTSFAKSTEDSSWDMISQHRQQLNKQIIAQGRAKQTHIDLNYNPGTSGTSQKNHNSEA